MNDRRKQDERRHEQGDVEDPIIGVLEHRGPMTTAEITAAVKKRLAPFPSDREQANKREGESKIDQVIANALQEKRRLCRDGLIQRVGRGEFIITDEGRGYLTKHRQEVAEAGAILDELYPNGIE
jgi:predicted transcriptional regulator